MSQYDNLTLAEFNKLVKTEHPEWPGRSIKFALSFLWINCTDKNGFNIAQVGDALPELQRIIRSSDGLRCVALRKPGMGNKSVEVLERIIETYKLLDAG